MKMTISTRTVTIETTEKGETLNRETVQALTQEAERKATWEHIERLALAAPATPIDETPDPLEGLNYTDVDQSVIAAEELANMVPANILAAE